MNLLALLLATSYAQKPTPMIPGWATIPEVSYLADCTDVEGVVAVTHAQKALLLDANGKVVSGWTVPKGYRVLRFEGKPNSTSALLVAAPRMWDIVSNEEYSPAPISLGQGMSTIQLYRGCTVQTQDSTFSLPRFWGAVTVRGDGKAISTIEHPLELNVPILREYTYNDHAWAESRDVITPMIEGLGFAVPLDRYDDLRYVGDHTLVFIGDFAVMQPPSQEKVNASLHLVLKESDLALEARANKSVCLFSLDLRSHITRAICGLRIFVTREFGAMHMGTISVSYHSKFIYLRHKSGVARLDSGMAIQGN